MVTDYDVIVIGEALVELSGSAPFAAGNAVTLGFSGDALNAAAAAAAAGAHTALLTKVADDELGHALIARVRELAVDTSLIDLVKGQQGAYFVHSDPQGQREFVYLRRGSAAGGLSAADIAGTVERAAVTLSSGVTGAISESAAAAVLAAARTARCFIYDPNFRPRLSTVAEAAALLARVAPHAALITPAFPAEAALLGVDARSGGSGALPGALPGTSWWALPAALRAALSAARATGARAVALTRGVDGVLLDDGHAVYDIPAVVAPRVVDQTGAGDVLAGTVAARLALGDPLLDAVLLGAAASSLSLAGRGGTGNVAPLANIRTHLRDHGVPYTELERPLAD